MIGIGGSIAANTVLATTRAALGAGGVTGAGSINVGAVGTHGIITTAEAGSDAEVGFGAAAAVSFSRPTTTAEMLAGGSVLAIGTTVDVVATHTNVITTTAVSETTGADAAAGAAIAVTIALDTTTARIARSLTAGGNVHVLADPDVTSNANATANQDGGFGSLLLDQHIGSMIDLPFVDDDDIPTLPAWVDILDDGEDEADLALPTLGLAAAIAVNVAMPTTLATIANNTTVTSGGIVSVTTDVDSDAIATADGSSVGNTANAGLAFAGNYAASTNTASIGNAIVTGASIVVAAGVTDALLNDASAWSGAGGVGAGLAGSVAVNAGANVTRAQVANGAQLVATGLIAITATGHLITSAFAGAGALGILGGVGASIAATIFSDLTEATIGNAQVNTPGAISVDRDRPAGRRGDLRRGCRSRPDRRGRVDQPDLPHRRHPCVHRHRCPAQPGRDGADPEHHRPRRRRHIHPDRRRSAGGVDHRDRQRLGRRRRDPEGHPRVPRRTHRCRRQHPRRVGLARRRQLGRRDVDGLRTDQPRRLRFAVAARHRDEGIRRQRRERRRRWQPRDQRRRPDRGRLEGRRSRSWRLRDGGRVDRLRVGRQDRRGVRRGAGCRSGSWGGGRVSDRRSAGDHGEHRRLHDRLRRRRGHRRPGRDRIAVRGYPRCPLGRDQQPDLRRRSRTS